MSSPELRWRRMPRPRSRRCAPWSLLLLLGCRPDPPPDPAARARLDAAFSVRFATGPLDLRRFEERSHRLEGYRVAPVQFQLRPDFVVAGALFEPDAPSGAGVVVAHGHFGQAKNAPETQEIAHRLAARGATVLLVDTPGMEEWSAPGHHLHFDEGAHGRAYLAAGGASALSLQVQLLQRGLDVLEGLGVSRMAATGASGGAVQSLYLLLQDPRVAGAVLASFPPMPREARAGGCPCDQLPGWPGPDDALMTLVDRPTLWLADGHDNRPGGLPRSARFVRLESPHSYDAAMQAEALDFLSELLDLRGGAVPSPPLLDLSTPGPQPGAPGQPILALPLPGADAWRPEAREGSSRLSVAVDCVGSGPTLLVAGGDAEALQATTAAGARACAVVVTPDEVGLAEGIATGAPYAGRVGLALQDAARVQRAVGIVAARAWATAAAASGLPHGVVDPIASVEAVDPERDPAWVHTPGVWWSGDPAARTTALAVGSPAEVAAALLDAR